jgi:hypothetical protein
VPISLIARAKESLYWSVSTSRLCFFLSRVAAVRRRCRLRESMLRSTKLPGLGSVLGLVEEAPCSGLEVEAMVWLPCEGLMWLMVELASWLMEESGGSQFDPACVKIVQYLS